MALLNYSIILGKSEEFLDILSNHYKLIVIVHDAVADPENCLRGSPITRKTYGAARRPSFFLTGFNRGRGAGPPGLPGSATAMHPVCDLLFLLLSKNVMNLH